MADFTSVLNTDVAGTNAAGLGVPVYDAPTLTPDKVLYEAIQYQENETKKNQAAARKALSDLNDIKVSGWVNHLEEIQKDKQDLLNKCSAFLQKYKGKDWNEFDPRNPEMSKDALEIQRLKSQLENKINFSNQIKQMYTHDESFLSNPKENNIDEDSAKAVAEFYKKPISEQQQIMAEQGKPELQQAYPDWKTNMIGAASALKSAGVRQTQEANGLITSHYDKRVAEQDIHDSFYGVDQNNSGGWIGTPQGRYAQKVLAKEMQKINPNVTGQDINNALEKQYRMFVQQPQVATSQRLSPVAAAQEKEKGVVGEPVSVDKVVTAPAVNDKGEAYVPLEYGGKHIYYDKQAPLTFKNDQQLKDFAGSVNEVYKVIKTNQGNFKTESVSSEEKSNFHPAGVMSNTKTGETALVMTAKNPKAVEPKNADIIASMTPEEKSDYNTWINSADDKDKANELYDKARQRTIDSGRLTKGSEDIMYIAPMDATLESKYNTLVSQPLRQTFPARKNWTDKKQAQGDSSDIKTAEDYYKTHGE